MFKLQCLILCVCYATVSIASLVPFIDKCKWDDQACLQASAQKAIPYFAAGLSNLGMPPLDPVKLNKVVYNENGLSLTFEDMTLKGTGQCVIKKIERNIAEGVLYLDVQCPIEVRGTYTASGKLMILEITGNGPFSVISNSIMISIKTDLKPVDGPDGQKHWQVDNTDFTYKFLEKAHLVFENLFNGDKDKSDAINQVISENWEPLVLTIGKGIVAEAVNTMMTSIRVFAAKVPTSELEL